VVSVPRLKLAHIGPILLLGEDGRSEACEVAFRNNCAQ